MASQLNRAIQPKTPRIRYRCPSCTDKHAGFPALAYALPDVIFALSPTDKERRAVVSGDLCVLDDIRYFVRCVLRVPVHACADELEYGPWVELDVRDFCRYSVHFNGGGHPAWTAAEGRLANAFPAPGSLVTRGGNPLSTLNLACVIRAAEDPAHRPIVEVVDYTHPIYNDQTDGIPLPRAMEIVSQMKGFLLLVD
jgi:hypothetical protein